MKPGLNIVYRNQRKASISVRSEMFQWSYRKGGTIGITNHSIAEACGTLGSSVDSLVKRFACSIALAGRLVEEYAVHREVGIRACFGPFGIHRHIVKDCLHIPFAVASQHIANSLHVREGVQLREFSNIIGFRKSIGTRSTPRVHDDSKTDIGICSEPLVVSLGVKTLRPIFASLRLVQRIPGSRRGVYIKWNQNGIRLGDCRRRRS